MKIGGFEKLTLIDFPGEIACIVFTQGCNFRCQFCYNPMLVWPLEEGKLKYNHEGYSLIAEDVLFDFLKERKGKLDGVVITGGEPTLHKDLPEFIAKIKKLGFKVKLDSNGTNPEMLARLVETRRGASLPQVDYLAMDIKAPLEKYETVVGVTTNLANIQKSVKIIMESGIPYEFRTTLVPGLHVKEDIEKMGEMIKGAEKPVSAQGYGEARWYLQFFKSDTGLVNNELEGKQRFTEREMEEMREIGSKYVGVCEIRG